MFTHKLEHTHGLQFKLRCQKWISSQGQGSHFNSGSISKTMLDWDCNNKPLTGSDVQPI